MKEITLDQHLKEKLKDPYFKELHELEQQKYDIVKRIIAYRVKKKMTQADLAKASGVTQQFISKIENGEFSNIMTLEKVLLHIGMTVRMKVVELNAAVKKQIQRSMAVA